MFIFNGVYNKRSNEYFLQSVNTQIVNLCKENNYDFMDQSNISSSHFYDEGLHLLESGKIILVNNIINYLNPQPLNHPNR